MEYKASIFLGRFQPFHLSHLQVAKQGLAIAEKLIFVIGSHRAATNTKNPFTFEQRKEMIQSCFSEEELKRIYFVAVRDYYYSDSYWVTEVQQKTSAYINYGDSVALLGSYKDNSSYYLKLFPQWEFIPAKRSPLNATDIRKDLYSGNTEYIKDIPPSIHNWLQKNYLNTEDYISKVKEYSILKEYKERWASSPFPPTFITVDAVVIQSGHILLVKRKFEPGKGNLALPGGFIRQNERIDDAVLRELREETGIKLPYLILKSSIVESKVFDYPERSLRGRTITHAYCFKLKEGELPDVRGNDDAEDAFWMPLMELGLKEDQFFEDHIHIIGHFINRF